MGYCCAVDCLNGSGSGKSLFGFPLKGHRKRLLAAWIAKVNRKGFKPTQHTKLCEDHFADHCFAKNKEQCRKAGCRLELKKDAIPTIFSHCGNPAESSKGKRRSLAAVKRSNLQTLREYENEGQDDAETGSPEHGDDSEADDDGTEGLGLAEECLPSVCRTCDTGTQHKPLVSPVACQTSRFGLTRSRGVQCNIPVSVPPKSPRRNVATQTEPPEAIPTPSVSTSCRLDEWDNNHDSDDSLDTDSMGDDLTDPEWTPGSQFPDLPDGMENSDDEATEIEEKLADSGTLCLEERKFLVFESCLHSLLVICPECTSNNCRVVLKRMVGSMAVIRRFCSNGHQSEWRSQPSHGTMPLGNLAIAAGILYSGSSPAKALNSLRHINIPVITYRTFTNLQAHYLIPAVLSVWQRTQDGMMQELGSEAMQLGGDARCCSPGHTAKYGSYSLMDLVRSKVIHFELIQSNEVSSSYAMELVGLKRAITYLEDNNISLMSLTTDRHAAVKKWMKDENPLVLHWFDVWHVAKGIQKKLMAAAQRRDCGIIQDWVKAVSNHVYWCAATSDGNGSLFLQKWGSILNHLADIHTGHGDLYPDCQHGPIDDRLWIKKGSKAHKELETVVMSKFLLRDLENLSPAHQTSSLESFHHVVCYFAPKAGHYFYSSMKARLTLAVLHFNENSRRTQAKKKLGEKMHVVSHPKGRHGEGVVKEVKVPCTYDYVRALMVETLAIRNQYPSYNKAKHLVQEYTKQAPPPVCTKFEKADKKTLVQSRMSRFNLT